MNIFDSSLLLSASVSSDFRREVDEIGTLLGCYAAYGANSFWILDP